MLGEITLEQAIRDGRLLSVIVATADLEGRPAGPTTNEPDQSRTEDDDRERDVEEENSDEGEPRQRKHDPVLQRSLADPEDGLEDHRQYGRLEPEEQGDDQGHIAPGGIDVAEDHNGDDAGDNEQPAGHDAAERAVHQPTDIGGELLGLGSRQEHAVVQGVQEPCLGDPALLLDKDAMHDRDLSGRAAEAEHGDARPDPERLAPSDPVSELRTGFFCDRNVNQGRPPLRRTETQESRSLSFSRTHVGWHLGR